MVVTMTGGIGCDGSNGRVVSGGGRNDGDGGGGFSSCGGSNVGDDGGDSNSGGGDKGSHEMKLCGGEFGNDFFNAVYIGLGMHDFSHVLNESTKIVKEREG